MTDGAERAAEGIERDAEARASAHLDGALDERRAIAARIGTLEAELSRLLVDVSREADGLRNMLGRVKLTSSAPGQALPRAASAAPNLDELLLEPAPTPAENVEPEPPAPEPAPEVDITATPEPAAAEVAEPEPVAVQPEPEPVAEPEPASPPSSVAGAEAGRVQDVKQRVTGKSDEELAELHRLAQSRGAREGVEGERSYWQELERAAVAEAAGRPDFGTPSGDDESLGRRAKKQRARQLGALIAARDEYLGAQAE